MCLGNIDGAGNFAFMFVRTGRAVAIRNFDSLGSSYENAVLNNNVIEAGNSNCKFKITFNTNKATVSWTGANTSSQLYVRCTLIAGDTAL